VNKSAAQTNILFFSDPLSLTSCALLAFLTSCDANEANERKGKKKMVLFLSATVHATIVKESSERKLKRIPVQ